MEQPPGKPFDWKKAPKGMPIPLDQLQRLDDLASRDHDESGGVGGDVIASAAMSGSLVPIQSHPVWVKITENVGAGLYSASQVLQSGLEFTTDEGLVELDQTLFEVNSNDAVDVDTIVQAWLSEDDTSLGPIWRFYFPTGEAGPPGDNTITVREVDLSPTVTDVSILEFDQADGFVVSSPGAGVARIDLVPTLIVREVDLNPSISAVNIVEFDQDDGFAISNPAAGRARVDLDWTTDGTINVFWTFNVTTTFTFLGGDNNYVIFVAPIKIKGDMYLDHAVISLGATTDNLDVSENLEEGDDGVVVLTFALDADSTLSGIIPKLDTGSGQTYKLENGSDTYVLTLLHDTDSDAENRFYLPWAKRLKIPPLSGVWIWYDPDFQKWFANAGWDGVAKFAHEVWWHYQTIDLGSAAVHNQSQGANRRPPVLRFTLASDATLTGLIHIPDGGSGQLVKIENVSSNVLTLAHDNAGSDAANRFYCPGGVDFDLPANGGVLAWYDPVSERWRINSSVPGGIPGGGDDGVTIYNCCCSDGIPDTLHLTITSDDCACLDGVEMDLIYHGTGWYGSAPVSCAGGSALEIVLQCTSGDWSLGFVCNCSPVSIPTEEGDCGIGPFDVVLGGVGPGACCESGDEIIFTITY